MSNQYGRDYRRSYEPNRGESERESDDQRSRNVGRRYDRMQNTGGRQRYDEQFGYEEQYGTAPGIDYDRSDRGERDYRDYRYGPGGGYSNRFNRGEYRGGRDYDDYGMGRGGSQDSESRRYGPEESNIRNYGLGYGGSPPYGRGTYGNRYSRDHERGESAGRGEERGWWDRATDEVSSWFGDEEAQRRRRMDEMRERHRGRGPKGYRRSDDRIKEDINDRLSDDWYLDATEIQVNVESGEVTLIGTVPNRADKRRAEDLAEDVSGVRNVENRLRVSQGVVSDMTTSTVGAGGTSATEGRTSAATSGSGSSGTNPGRGGTT